MVEDDDDDLLDHNAVWTCRQIPMFRRNTMTTSSVVKTAHFSETLVHTGPHGIITLKKNIVIIKKVEDTKKQAGKTMISPSCIITSQILFSKNDRP